MLKKYSFLDKTDKAFGRLAEWIFDHRAITSVLCLLFLSLGMYFAAQARTDNSLESYFDSTDPVYNNYKGYQKDFGSDEIGYILYEAPQKEYGPFDIDVMRKIADLTEALENEVPFVREVTSLANVEFIEAEGDNIEISELLLDFPENQQELLRIRDRVMRKPIYMGSLINKEGTHAAIILEMLLTSSDPLEKIRLDPKGGDGLDNLYPQVSNRKIKEILSRPEYKGIKFYRSGDVTMNSAYNEIITTETGILVLATFVLVSLISMICFRMRLLGFFGPLAVVMLSLVLTVGFMGMMGYPLGILFLMTPTLLTAIGVAQSIHVLSEFQISLRKGLGRREALRQTMEHVGVPCLLAALTTAVGFLSMAGSQLKAISDFAVFGALGVIIAFVLSVTLLICLMSFDVKKLVRKKPDTSKKEYQQDSNSSGNGLLVPILNWIIACNLRYRRGILIITALIFVFSCIGISKLTIAFNFLEEFKKKTEFRQNVTYIEKIMGGLLSVVYVFDTGKPDGIKDSDVLKQLQGLQIIADKNPLVRKTYSIVDILKDINQTFHGDDPAYYRLPENRELISQYLLMYEMSGGKELEDYVTGDYARTALELRVELTDSIRIENLIRSLDSYMVRNPVTSAEVKPTGMGLLWIRIADYIGSSMMRGYLAAFIVIAFFMCVATRSIKLGLLSMIPNLAPIALTLGLMGWCGIHLDYFRMLLATIAIGIAVDDTIHLVIRTQRDFYRCGDYALAMRNSISSVGRAMILTSVVLFSAFLIFLSSQMAVLASFGALLALTIATALIADMFLMPVLIMFFKPFGKEFVPE